ncbi:MAG: methionyl-tRNA formyltransferase [Planctomycetales bacterium]|nr:methionyl-tRNA formyltransferase [Planctomycetales bacterium]
MSLRIVFMGTGNLALPSFLALRDSKHTLVGLVTQPDRVGRGHHQHVNPVKTAAVERGIPVLQPDSIKTAEAIADLKALTPDLCVVAAYGQMLSIDVLKVPQHGTINIHASLLPQYRGATPIHAAILNGDAETGVTIIEIEQKMDAGAMLGRARTPINPGETTGQLEQRLADLAVPLTLQVIDEIVNGTARREIQDSAQATHVRKLSKTDGRINWNQPANTVARHVLGMQPWPGPFTELHQIEKLPLRMQILAVEECPIEQPCCANPGGVIAVTPQSFVIRCADNAVRVLCLKPDGKRPMSTADFLRGRPIVLADQFY